MKTISVSLKKNTNNKVGIKETARFVIKKKSQNQFQSHSHRQRHMLSFAFNSGEKKKF